MMNDRHKSIFLTGATGVVGRQLLRELRTQSADMRIFVLVRSVERWESVAAQLGRDAAGVTAVAGDITKAGLGLGAVQRAELGRHVTAVVHCAADVCFSRPLDEARRVNTDGARHVIEIAEDWAEVRRIAHVSTAYVAGTRTGVICEESAGLPDAWVNAYEQSKHEAEQHVRASTRPWVVFRPTSIACESELGVVRQVNAIHRSLALLRAGLASMLPGNESTPMDMTTTAYVAEAIGKLALRSGVEGRTFHLCAGKGAMPLGEMLERCFAHWSREPEWRRRGVARPALTDMATYRLFEEAVEETADARLRATTRSLSHFVPQLALPKFFDTAGADAALGFAAPEVSSFWSRMLDHLVTARASRTLRRAA